MKKEELIKKLQALTDGIEVVIVDSVKNEELANAGVMGKGIEKRFKVDALMGYGVERFAGLVFNTKKL